MSSPSRHFFGVLFTCLTATVVASPFQSPTIAIDDGANLRFTRNTTSQAAFDSNGVLHLAYWVGGDETNVANPSFVYYRNWTTSGGWSDAIVVDQSFNESEERLGGRQPSLAVGPDGAVWVAWHDYRHVNPASSSIDNLEIYIDRIPPGGDSFDGNIRLTETSAAHSGDNGYSPQIAIGTDGRVHVVWHDFHAAPEISDIHYRVSDVNGVFPASEVIGDHRVTNFNDRSPGAAAYTLPALAIAGDGAVHAAWGSGTGGAAPMLHGRLDGVTFPISGTEITPSGGSFFDPPRLVPSPAGGIWLVYTDRQSNNLGVVTLRYLPGGGSEFGAPVLISGTGGMTTNQPSARVGEGGVVHLVYRRSGVQTHLYYRTWDPVEEVLGGEIQVTETSGTWLNPVLLLDGNDQPWVLFEEDLGTSLGRIWMVRPDVETSVGEWLLWE